ncbi:MAG: hypothetical protein FJ395_18730 [Verrucomicrobia bacterium]|nr:hypothetical protein [Verrucomicrobiota bacterium]
MKLHEEIRNPTNIHHTRTRTLFIAALAVAVVGNLLAADPGSARNAMSERFNDHASAIPRDAVCVDPSVSATHAERVQGLINAAAEGQTFVFKAGTHFLGELKPKHRQQFYGQVVNGQLATILTGAKTIAPGSFTYDTANKVYKLVGQTQSDKMTAVMPGADGKPTPMTLRPHERVSFRYDVLKNNKFLRHATLGTDWTDHTPRDFARLGPSSFFFDYANDTIYLKDNPDDANALIEVMRYECAFWCGNEVEDRNRANGVTFRNLIFEKYATFINQGAVRAQGNNWLIEDNEFRKNHAVGISCGVIKAYAPRRNPDKMPGDIANYPSGTIIRHNYVHDNGGAGIQVYAAHQVLIEGNECCYNNWFNWTEGMTSGPDNNFGFKLHWEASGIKVIYYGHDTTVKGNYIHDENCTGVWVDVEAVNTVVEDNLIRNTMLSGICVEISKNTTVRNNRLICNGTGQGAGEYCNQVSLDSTWATKVYGNKMKADTASGGAGTRSLIGVICRLRDMDSTGEGFMGSEIFGNEANILKPLSARSGAVCFEAKNISPDTARRSFLENRLFGNRYYFDPSVAERNDYVVKGLPELASKPMRFEHVQGFGQELRSELVTAPHEIDESWIRQPPATVDDLPTVITPTGSNTFVSVVRNPTLIGTCNGSTMKDLKVTVNGKVYAVPSAYNDKLPRDADGRVYHNRHSGLWSLTLPNTGRLNDGKFAVRVEAIRKSDNRILGQEYALNVSAVAFTNALTDPRPRQEGAKPPSQTGKKGKQMTQEERKALIRKELLEKYDTDKDGKLSKDETAKMSNEDRRKNYMAMTDEEKAKAKAYMSMTPEQKAKVKAYQESKQGHNR